MKKQNAFDKARDQSAADRDEYPKGFSPPQMCTAHGCPNRWTVDSDDRRIHKLCSAHAWADSSRWPEITQQQQWDETDRARLRGDPKAQALPISREERLEILERLRATANSMRTEPAKEHA